MKNILRAINYIRQSESFFIGKVVFVSMIIGGLIFIFAGAFFPPVWVGIAIGAAVLWYMDGQMNKI